MSRQRPQACHGVSDSVAVAALYQSDTDWEFIRDTTTLRGIRFWPPTTDSIALAEARRSELYLCMALHDTLLVVSNMPGVKSLNEWTRPLTETDIVKLFPSGYELIPPEPYECGEDDCCCGPDYMEVHNASDTVLFEGDSLFELCTMRLMSNGVSFAGLQVGMPVDSVAELMALPVMDYSGYRCLVIVEPSETYEAWYGLTDHYLNQDPNPGQSTISTMLLEIDKGRISQIRLNLDHFERGMWRCAARGINSWY